MASPVVPATVILLVAVISLALAVITYRGHRRTGNPRLVFVTAGFLAFFLKGVVVSILLWDGRVPHDTLETLEAFLDLMVIVLMALPLTVRR